MPVTTVANTKPPDVRVWLCGVRGSTSAPGSAFARVGGHTSCVALGHDGSPPTLVLDAGTGIRRLTEVLGEAPFHGTILLTPLHWDHTEGLPFFRGGDRPDARTTIVVPRQGRRGALTLLSRTMSPPSFPITHAALLGSAAGARRVMPSHHDPGRTDVDVEVIARIVASEHHDLLVEHATEGRVIDL